MEFYYINNNGQQVGPFTPEQLRTQPINPNTMVWSRDLGMQQWVPASHVPELAPLFGATLQGYQQPVQQQPIQQPVQGIQPKPKSSNTPKIALGILGALAVLGIVGAVLYTQTDIFKNLFSNSNTATEMISEDSDVNNQVSEEPSTLYPPPSTTAAQVDSLPSIEGSETLPQESDARAASTIYMDLGGYIGSGEGAQLTMNGTTGWYLPNENDNVKRQLKLESYDEKTGRCVLKAYLKGKQIGKFDGKYETFYETDDDGGEHGAAYYQGTFTNTINGVKLKFNLYAD